MDSWNFHSSKGRLWGLRACDKCSWRHDGLAWSGPNMYWGWKSGQESEGSAFERNPSEHPRTQFVKKGREHFSWCSFWGQEHECGRGRHPCDGSLTPCRPEWVNWRFSTEWYGTVRHGSLRYGTVRYGTAQFVIAAPPLLPWHHRKRATNKLTTKKGDGIMFFILDMWMFLTAMERSMRMLGIYPQQQRLWWQCRRLYNTNTN